MYQNKIKCPKLGYANFRFINGVSDSPPVDVYIYMMKKYYHVSLIEIQEILCIYLLKIHQLLMILFP